MASRLGPLYSLLGVAKRDWTSSLQNSESQVVIESGSQAFVFEVLSESFRDKLLNSSEPTWIFLGQVLREDEEILYAFENPRERTLFEELRSIDGIGPKSAALLVGRVGLKGFREILENPKAIATVKVPGLGPKNLEKISLGLKQKKEHFLGIVGARDVQNQTEEMSSRMGTRSDLESALVQLGLKSFEARALYEKMCEENEAFADMALQELLQEALKWWGRSRSKSTSKNEKSLERGTT
jgi:Holliday junction DNA helicase RuvA